MAGKFLELSPIVFTASFAVKYIKRRVQKPNGPAQNVIKAI